MNHPTTLSIAHHDTVASPSVSVDSWGLDDQFLSRRGTHCAVDEPLSDSLLADLLPTTSGILVDDANTVADDFDPHVDVAAWKLFYSAKLDMMRAIGTHIHRLRRHLGYNGCPFFISLHGSRHWSSAMSISLDLLFRRLTHARYYVVIKTHGWPYSGRDLTAPGHYYDCVAFQLQFPAHFSQAELTASVPLRPAQ